LMSGGSATLSDNMDTDNIRRDNRSTDNIRRDNRSTDNIRRDNCSTDNIRRDEEWIIGGIFHLTPPAEYIRKCTNSNYLLVTLVAIFIMCVHDLNMW
ncbi:unnamed protein product, partial [Rotaria socialis]